MSAPRIHVDPRTFEPWKVQALTHALSDHPLLQIGALVELGERQQARNLVRTHSADATAGTSFADAPNLHPNAKGAATTLADIANARAWMSLLNVQADPVYRDFIDEILDEVKPITDRRDPGMCYRAGWIFVSSPNTVTPFHMDHEHNFIMQIRGTKRLYTWEPTDRIVISERAQELFHDAHSRELVTWSEDWRPRARVLELAPGLGGYMPSTGPHMVENGPSHRSRSASRTTRIRRASASCCTAATRGCGGSASNRHRSACRRAATARSSRCCRASPRQRTSCAARWGSRSARMTNRMPRPDLLVAHALVALAAACSSPKTLDAPASIDLPGNVPGQPGVGAHGLAFYRLSANGQTSIATPPLATQPSGSTLIVGVARGNASAFALPTDNMGNSPYQQLGTVEPYTRYPDSGTATYAFPSATGGAGLAVRTSTVAQDEITISAVEVTGATHVQDAQWIEQLAAPLASKSVTTTGPATLVAFWWGDAPEPNNKTATPNNGFVVLDSILASGALVQGAVAVKNVGQAGTYDVTWVATPAQGAQLWLIAVQ